MSTPIYQLVIGKNNVGANMAWNAMPEAEQKALNEQEEASRKAVGVSMVVGCASAWADEEHPYWGVLRFPSLEARMEHTRTLQKIGWLEKMDAFILLGTSEAEPEPVTIPNPIYKLWLIRRNAAAEMALGSVTPDIEKMVGEKHDALYKEFNSKTILSCKSNWCNEAYPFFGVSVYPNIEANMHIQDALNGLGWPKFIDSFTLLGTPMA